MGECSRCDDRNGRKLQIIMRTEVRECSRYEDCSESVPDMRMEVIESDMRVEVRECSRCQN